MRYCIGSVYSLLGALLAAVICSGTAFAQASGEQTDIVVNGVALSADTVRALQQVYPVAIAPGCFGYDAVSGAYGRAPMGVDVDFLSSWVVV